MRRIAKFFFYGLFWVTLYILVTKTTNWEGKPYGIWVAFYLIAVLIFFLLSVERVGRAYLSRENSKEKDKTFSLRFLCIGLALIYLGFAWYNLPSVVDKREGYSKIINDLCVYEARRNAYPIPKDTVEKLWVLEGERDMMISQIRLDYYHRLKEIDPTYGENTIVISIVLFIVGFVLLVIAILPQRIILFLIDLIINN